MAGPLANIPICMLGGDTREVMLAEALVDLEVDLRLVGFPLQGKLRKPPILQILLRLRRTAELSLHLCLIQT